MTLKEKVNDLQKEKEMSITQLIEDCINKHVKISISSKLEIYLNVNTSDYRIPTNFYIYENTKENIKAVSRLYFKDDCLILNYNNDLITDGYAALLETDFVYNVVINTVKNCLYNTIYRKAETNYKFVIIDFNGYSRIKEECLKYMEEEGISYTPLIGDKYKFHW